MGYVEEKIFAQYSGRVPDLYCRYIDDIIGIASCSREELENFIHFFNLSIHLWNSPSKFQTSALRFLTSRSLSTTTDSAPVYATSLLTLTAISPSHHLIHLLARSSSPSLNFFGSAASVVMIPSITSKPQRCHCFSTTEIILNTSPVLQKWKLRPSPMTKPSDQLLPTKLTWFLQFLHHTILSTSGSPKSCRRTSTPYLLTPLPTLLLHHLLYYPTAKTIISEILWHIPNSHPNRTTLPWTLVIAPNIKPANSLTALISSMVLPS